VRIVGVGLLASVPVVLGGYESYRRIVYPLLFRVRIVLNFALRNLSLLGHDFGGSWLGFVTKADSAPIIFWSRVVFSSADIVSVFA
jgi:hypothetical protein